MDLTSEIEDRKNKNSDQPTEIKRIVDESRSKRDGGKGEIVKLDLKMDVMTKFKENFGKPPIFRI